MKSTTTSISPLASATFVAILAVIFILSRAPTTVEAATDNTNTGTAVRCPTGYTCVPKAATSSVVCPTGYVCTPKSTTNTISRPTTAYRTGSYTNLILRPQEQTLTPAQIQAAAQAQAAAQVQSQIVASSSATSSGQQLYVINNINVASSSGNIASSSNADLAVQFSGGELGMRANGFYVETEGGHMKSRCGANQFFDIFSRSTQKCVNNFATSSPLVINPSSTGSVGGKITDPYCPGVISGDTLGGSRFLTNLSSTSARPVDRSANEISTMQTQGCVIGEANRNVPYVNPWVTVNNLWGLVNVRYPDTTRPGKYLAGSNFCRSSITLTEAKKRNDQQLAAGVHNDLYTSNSKLYVPTSPSLHSDFEMQFVYSVDHGTPGSGVSYWWNGVSQGMYSNDDIKNPEFLALFNTMQFGLLDPLNTLSYCLDSDYKSNLPAVVGHYQSLIKYLRSIGLVQ